MHSIWALDVGTGLAIAERRRAKTGVGIDWQVTDVNVTDVRRLLTDIHAAQERLMDLFSSADDAFKALGPSRRR